MKTFKRSFLFPALMAGVMAVSLSGCVYAGNKSWDDMTPEEQAEVRQTYQDVKGDLEAAFPGSGPMDEWVRDILRRVGQAIPPEDSAVQTAL